MAKQDLPNANSIGSGNLTSEYSQMTYLYSLLPRTSSGDITYTSTSSGIVYSTATYSSGKYANQGQNGMLSILGEILANNLITSTDFNNKTETSAFNTHLADTSPHSELVARTIYVSTTGNDTTGNGTSGTPYATTNKALSTIKKNMQVSVTITLANGTYNEDVVVSGFYGGSIGTSLAIVSTSGVAANCTITSVTFSSNSITTQLLNVTANSTTKTAISISKSIETLFSNCVITAAASQAGISVSDGSTANISSCTISNRSMGISCDMSRVFSNANSGTANTIGLYSANSGTIGKYSTQPAGTTAESTGGGGVIR